jgi:hypothetical protein
MHQMPQDEVFQSDNVLSEVELELIWAGEERMYCLSRLLQRQQSKQHFPAMILGTTDTALV